MLDPAAVSKKQRRAKRARARQRDRHRHDHRDRYRAGDLPPDAGVVAVQIEDPYSQAGHIDVDGNLDIEARLKQTRHRDGTVAQGAPAWVPPTKPRIVVVRSLKDDPLGRMHSRHQIDEAQFQAARAFQETSDQATLGTVCSLDLSKTKVSGGAAPDLLTDAKKRSMALLRYAENQIEKHHGAVGLWLVRAVLVDRNSVEHTAKSSGAESDREIASWGWLFRKCLDCLAKAFGFSNSTKRPYRPNGHDVDDPALDPRRHAVEVELLDPALRSGRAK
jgi:hypothetical protein